MVNPLSSPERLKDRGSREALKRTFIEHGALGYGITGKGPGLTEIEKLGFVPLIFGLLPAVTLERASIRQRVKPAIRDHLARLGLPQDELLVDIIKAIADRYLSTWPGDGPGRPRRLQVSDLRALGRPYRKILDKQDGRCATCGRRFDGDLEEQLDHVIPWRLIGDVLDGANWQLLCGDCNLGKKAFITTLQSQEAWNWLYGASIESLQYIALATRYTVLAQRRACEFVGCGAGPLVGALFAVRIHRTGLPVADNLRILCELHLAED